MGESHTCAWGMHRHLWNLEEVTESVGSLLLLGNRLIFEDHDGNSELVSAHEHGLQLLRVPNHLPLPLCLLSSHQPVIVRNSFYCLNTFSLYLNTMLLY